VVAFENTFFLRIEDESCSQRQRVLLLCVCECLNAPEAFEL
jgi:hypothetical protein